MERPNTLISDGAPNFNDVFNKEFFTVSNPRTKHIKYIRFRGDHNNNKMERFNGEVRMSQKWYDVLSKNSSTKMKGASSKAKE